MLSHQSLWKTLTGVLTLLLTVSILIWYASGPMGVPSADIITFSAFEDAVKHESPASLTLVTYNIGYASAEKNNQPIALTEEEVLRNLDEIAAALQTLDADIICLQEVDFDAARTFGINMMRYLAEQLNMPYAAYLVLWNKRYVPWPYWPPQIHFGRMLDGQAVLSRFPILEQSAVIFEKPLENDLWYNWFYPDRGAQRVALKVGRMRWDIWNVHLEAFHAGTRRRQLADLAEAVQGDDATALVAGDVNEGAGLWLDAFTRDAGLKRSKISIDMPSYALAVDHLFFSEALSFEEGGYVSSPASDHVPVWALFSVRRH